MAETMGLVCMAEAQATIAFRAESKGSLPGTVASLLVGASGTGRPRAFSFPPHSYLHVFKLSIPPFMLSVFAV